MKIQSIRTIAGPNIYHNRPVLIMTLELEDLTDRSSESIPDFTKNLTALLPGLHEHRCSPGYVGGFVERLHKGTYFAHIVEHIALELSELVGIGVGYGKSIYGDAPGVYQVIIRYKNEEGMIEVLRAAVKLADAIAHGETFDLEGAIITIKNKIRKNELGPSTQAILKAAIMRNIPWKRLNEFNLVQLGYGKYRKFIQATTSSITSDIAVDIAQNKDLTKYFLREGAIRVPYGKVVRSLEEAILAFNEIGEAVVVKPYDGNHGRGVSINLKTKEEVAAAFEIAHSESDAVLVEEFFKGLDYRIIVVGGKMIAAAWREAAHVTGDGIHNLAELVALENMNPMRGEGHEKPLTKISFDPSIESLLKKNQISLEMIPLKGQKIYLRETANLSTGGTATDVTDQVHPEVRLLCERAAKIIGLDICGIDLIMEDISKPLAGQIGGVIEVNAGPGIRMHHYPNAGEARDVGGAIIDFMYPGHHNGRIPIISITGTNGKTTVTRLISHIVTQTGMIVGSTTTDGIYINNNLVAEGDTTGPISAQNILFDPSVEFAVFETARGGLAKRGLGYDWSDVGIITNVAADHLGQDGINSIEDVVRIKSLVVERVRKGGTVILNADCPELVALAKNPQMEMDQKQVIFYSIKENSPIISEHIAQGKTAFYLKDNRVYQSYEGLERFIVEAHEIPMTIHGSALFNVSNALAGLAACKAVGLPYTVILEGVRTFDLNDNNPGRTNIYQYNESFVLLDYAHNPDALLNIGEMIAKWDVSSLTGVIAVPGDRADDLIKMSGIAAAHVFEKIIIREDEDLRGRKPGEVAQLILSGIINENTDVPTTIVTDPMEALKKALLESESKEVVAYFYEDFQKTENLLIQMGAKKISPAQLAQKNYRHYTRQYNGEYQGDQGWHQH